MYELIESLCLARNINITQMCREAGVPRGNLTDLKKGRQSGLSAKNLQKIAEYFNVSVSYLLGTEQKEKPNGNADGLDSELIRLLMDLTPEEETKALAFIQGLKAGREK